MQIKATRTFVLDTLHPSSIKKPIKIRTTKRPQKYSPTFSRPRHTRPHPFTFVYRIQPQEQERTKNNHAHEKNTLKHSAVECDAFISSIFVDGETTTRYRR